jgi:hypothetical protein
MNPRKHPKSAPAPRKETVGATGRVMWANADLTYAQHISCDGTRRCVLVLPLDAASCAAREEAVAKAVHETNCLSVPWKQLKPGAGFHTRAMRLARAALRAVSTRLAGKE